MEEKIKIDQAARARIAAGHKAVGNPVPRHITRVKS
jgi:hypothetical protein